MRIGVLALQGDFAEHIHAFRGTPWNGALEPVEVRLPEQLQTVDGLVIPGGESTTIGKLMKAYELLEPVRERVRSGMPVLGTCAGAILLAKDIGGLDQPLIGCMDITMRRNAFGRQLDSFETELAFPVLGTDPLPAVFIRAPIIEEVGPGVDVLARLPDGAIVAAAQRNMLAVCFHSELTRDHRLHRYFAAMVQRAAATETRA